MNKTELYITDEDLDPKDIILYDNFDNNQDDALPFGVL
jgi:hypothetical protein